MRRRRPPGTGETEGTANWVRATDDDADREGEHMLAVEDRQVAADHPREYPNCRARQNDECPFAHGRAPPIPRDSRNDAEPRSRDRRHAIVRRVSDSGYLTRTGRPNRRDPEGRE